jgi:hypothetical protein
MNASDYTLISFKAISDLVNELGEIFVSKDKNHSLKLYEHLLNKTTLSHDKAIKKHVDIFREFCIANREAITTKNISKLQQNKVIYSSRVYIDFANIFKDADKETTEVILKHLLTISALVDPAGKAKKILKESKDSKEANFLSDIINKVESNVNPNSNPMEAVSSIMSSGVFNELISGMNSGIQNGELDLGKLMGTVQTMCASLTGDVNTGTENPMNIINSLMTNMATNPAVDGGGVPDLSNLTSILGPMMAGLANNNNKGLPTIEEISKLKLPSIKEENRDDALD